MFKFVRLIVATGFQQLIVHLLGAVTHEALEVSRAVGGKGLINRLADCFREHESISRNIESALILMVGVGRLEAVPLGTETGSCA